MKIRDLINQRFSNASVVLDPHKALDYTITNWWIVHDPGNHSVGDAMPIVGIETVEWRCNVYLALDNYGAQQRWDAHNAINDHMPDKTIKQLGPRPKLVWTVIPSAP